MSGIATCVGVIWGAVELKHLVVMARWLQGTGEWARERARDRELTMSGRVVAARAPRDATTVNRRIMKLKVG
jgi:hypothetical protein